MWTASATRSQALFLRRQGKAKLLLVKDLNVFYGPVQILFDVSIEIGEGEVVALLGTNGAGKSTLLRAISGVVEADFGAIIFDGRDITHAPPYEIAPYGVTQMPGGAGVFPSLSVRENLRVAGWLDRKNRDRAPPPRSSRCSTRSPSCASASTSRRPTSPVANSRCWPSGMALLAEPKLLMIDELSLGLAPVVVEQLAEIVRGIAAKGTTIIIVEQSVNVALTLAETAYFMEKGQIRFSGPTAELLDRPDILHSVFLGNAGQRRRRRRSDGASGAIGRPRPDRSRRSGHERVGDQRRRSDQRRRPTTARPRGRRPPSRPPNGHARRRPCRCSRSTRCRSPSVASAPSTAVSLSVGNREIVGLIGPNGAGKTTLLDMISGFTASSAAGSLLAGGDVTRMAPDERARIGLGRSFQDARLFPSLTVAETIAVAYDRWVSVKDPIHPMLRLPAYVDSEDAVATRVDELIALFELETVPRQVRG